MLILILSIAPIHILLENVAPQIPSQCWSGDVCIKHTIAPSVVRLLSGFFREEL